ncbi:MAG: peptide ABC transporter substrate-binding protein [Bdellovibrionales bacterium]|nr:peptide ABC transporter substrate-binding protein [Bdellovibrionales bacterium]
MLNKKIIATIILGLFIGNVGGAVDANPKVEKRPPQKGTFYYPLNSEPERLNPINSSDLVSRFVKKHAVEGLLKQNIDTYIYEPCLAEKYETAKDGMSYTFYLRKGVKFHNGEELTADIVKWNYEARMDDAYKAFHIRPYLDNIKNVEIIDKYTVKFNIKRKYFGNLDSIGSYTILGIVPKSVYGNPNDKKANKKLVGTGPYMLEKYNKGSFITLKRNPNWWGYHTDKLSEVDKGAYNFDKIQFRFVKEDNVHLEMLKKGKLDWGGLTPEQYVKKTDGKPWGTKVLKKAVINLEPKSYGFVAWNFKNPLFQSRDVREALARLMNRKLMNEKFNYNRALLATGPWYRQSPYADPNVKPFEFDPAAAKKLLNKAGWKDTDKDGILDKVINGKKTSFAFSLMYANKDADKYFTIYKEDLKKAGIVADLKVIEWNSFVKALDEQKFDAVALAWGGGDVNNDPKQIWHSTSNTPGGSNFISYSNKEVDKLIDEGRQILDNDKRKPLWKKIYRIIANDAPYAFMFVNKYAHYAVNSRVKQPVDTHQYAIGTRYWWIE